MNSSGPNGFNKKVLPPAVAIWPMLNDVDSFLPESTRRGIALDVSVRYTLHLKFENEYYDEVQCWLKDCLNRFDLPRGRLPWKPDGFGHLLIATSSRRPVAIDAAKNIIPPTVIVGNGSRLKAYVTAEPQLAFGGGINLHVNSYQVLELNMEDQDPFKVETGYLLHNALPPAEPCNRPGHSS